MVSQRSLAATKRQFQAIIKEIKQQMNANELNIGVLKAYEGDVQEQFEVYRNQLNEFIETLPENEENDKILENFETVLNDGRIILSHIKGEREVLEIKATEKEKEKQRQIEAEEKEKQRQIEAEEREKQRQIEAEEREKQRRNEAEEKERERQFEIEKMKMEIEIKERESERLHTIEIERLKIQSEQQKLESHNVQLQMENLRVELESKIIAGRTDASSFKNSIKLPKLELKRFDGDILKWQEFWDTFDSTINSNQALQKVDKFKYLKSQLTGKAADTVTGLDITNENYDTAIEILKERYGKLNIIIDAHYARLTSIAPPSFNTVSLRSFYDATEKHIRSLKSLGQDVNNRHILNTLKSKLPLSILEKLEQRKEREEEWTMNSFRKQLHEYLNMKEETEYQVRLFQGEKNQTPRYLQKTFESSQSTGEALLSNERRQRGCIYCDGRHWSDECRKYATVTDRKERIKDRCCICFSKQHHSKDCKKDKICVYCGESKLHHRSLCSRKFASTSNEIRDPKETGLISVGENVIMQTALVEASNPLTNMFIKTRLLLDTGSQRTYITKELSDKLKLQKNETETFTVYTFGNKKPKEVTTEMVDINLKTKLGKSFTVRASVVPHITGTIQRSPIDITQKRFLENDFELADNLPTSMQTSSIGILIGNDYYQDIIFPERRKLDAGLYVINSKFGWILSGRTSNRKTNSVESSMFVLTSITSKIPKEVRKHDTINNYQNMESDLEEFRKLDDIEIEEDRDSNNVIKVNELAFPRRYVNPDRLCSMYKTWSNNKELLKQYDGIKHPRIQSAKEARLNYFCRRWECREQCHDH